MKNRIYDTNKTTPVTSPLWDGQHKIPWNDPVFSARILKEHLSQDHHLASRKQQAIENQCAWIHSRYLSGETASILDLGCGPGLYAELLAGDEHDYIGIDFSPASIEYASSKYAHNKWYSFVLGDVVEADFGGLHDLGMMLYGEINVFPPHNTRRILSKAHASLKPGGTFIIEMQRFETVKGVGESPTTKTEADAGLFSDSPYVCLTENTWHEDEGIAQQVFTVQAEDEGDSKVYKSTTKAWTEDEMIALLNEVGFSDITPQDDWPNPGEAFRLLTAIKR